MTQQSAAPGRGDALGDALELGAVRVGFLLHTLLALALAFVPLFDVLGFERALASGLLASPVSAAVGISVVRSARAKGGGDLARVASHAVGVALLMLIPTLVAGVVVELITQPCDQQQGIIFLLLLAGGNTIFGAALGTVAGIALPRRPLPGIAVALTLLGFLGAALWRLYSEPQIFLYSLSFGYWPGSLYDEDIEVHGTLWVFRGLTLLVALAVIALARAFTDPRTLTLSLARPRLTTLLGALLLAFVAATTWRAGESLGFSLTRETLERELSRHLVTPHFELFIAPNVSAEDVERLKEDHEFRYQQLSRFFKVEPKQRIKSFIYATERQKRRLMGAAGTQISRPWAHEIHINGFGVPHPVLKHELAHVFAAEIASGPFKVPASAGVLVNVGVVEGTAVAADWPASELSIHGWTRAMRALHLAPDVAQMLDPAGFWAISSYRAYTVAGSFVRWLIDTEGMERFARLYATNDFQGTYGRPLSELATSWGVFVDGLPLPPNELLMAEQRFKRPSIFQKVCAHKAATLSRQGYQRLASGDVDAGIERLEQLVAYAPANVQPLIDIAETLARTGHPDEARHYVRRALETPDIGGKSISDAKEALAGLEWRGGELDRARADYEAVLNLHLSTQSDRMQTARLAALGSPPEAQDVLRPFLLGELGGGLALVRLGEVARAHPREALPHYLYGRQLENAGAYPEGIAEIRAVLASDGGLKRPDGGLASLADKGPVNLADKGPANRASMVDLPGVLVPEAKLTLGRLLLRAHRAGEAREVFADLAAHGPSEAIRLMAADWAERASMPPVRLTPERTDGRPE